MSRIAAIPAPLPRAAFLDPLGIGIQIAGPALIRAASALAAHAKAKRAAAPRRAAARARTCSTLETGTRTISAGDRGVTYDDLVVPYLASAPIVTIIDPYLRDEQQIQNLADLLESIGRTNNAAPTKVEIITTAEDGTIERACRQAELLLALRANAALDGLSVSVAFDSTIHDRSITTHEWQILLGKGLDFWHRPGADVDPLTWRRQELREVAKTFHITYNRVS